MIRVGLVTPHGSMWAEVALTERAFSDLCVDIEKAAGCSITSLMERDEFWEFIEIHEAYCAEFQPEHVVVTGGDPMLEMYSDAHTLEELLENIARDVGYVIPVAWAGGDVSEARDRAWRRLVESRPRSASLAALRSGFRC